MKKTRSITAKNITGSLFGGILGILAFGYVHPIGLPIGCLLGVLIGWWYESIIQKSMDGWRRGENRSHKICEGMADKSVRFTNRIMNIDYLYPLRVILAVCSGVMSIFFAMPRVIGQWVRIRPMCAIHFTNVLASIAALIITSYWFMPLMSYISGKANNTVPGSDAWTLLVLMQLVIVLVIVMSLIAPFLELPEGREYFYKTWDHYERLGMVKYFLRGIVQTITLQMFSTSMLIGIVLWYVIVWGSFFIAILAPIGLVAGTVKGFYHVSQKTDHWLCLGSTLFVTVLSAWLMNSYFGNPQVLWTVALVTGGASALITEFLRRMIIHFCDEISFLQKLVHYTIGEQTKPSRQIFKKVTGFVGCYYSFPFVYAMRKWEA